jgi:hypothetical protein
MFFFLAGIDASTVGSLHFINILRFNRFPVFWSAKRYVHFRLALLGILSNGSARARLSTNNASFDATLFVLQQWSK